MDVEGDAKRTTPLIKSITQPDMAFSYEYDVLGNITKEVRGGVETTYQYDDLGQLIRVNDPHDVTSGDQRGTTWRYGYDCGGNILSKTSHVFTAPETEVDLTANPGTQTGYRYDPFWKDRLWFYGDDEIISDPVGNPMQHKGKTYYWMDGRKLWRIAEGNMTAMAAGLASVGYIPFVNTFAVFLTSIGLTAARIFASYAQLPIKLVGAYGGLSDSFDGPSHHSIEDIAIMRALPNVQVFVPCDAAQVEWLVQYAMKTPSPMYIRLSRDAFPNVYPQGEAFACGKGNVMRDGSDLTIVACGLMVAKALEAARRLAEEGISARVVDMFCIKPIDADLIGRCAQETGAILCAEEHSVIGGLGGAVAQVLVRSARPVPVEFVGVEDCHAQSGPYDALQESYGLSAGAIVTKAWALIKRKG